MATSALIVYAEAGQKMHGEVKAVVAGGVRVELDTCEMAFIPVGGLAGRNRDDKSNRHACLRIGINLEVEIMEVDRSTRTPNIRAREVIYAASTGPEPRRTGRVLQSING